MSDTIKIKRPHFERKPNGVGRVQHDGRGNAVWVRTRATDSHDIPVSEELSLVDESPRRSRRRQTPTAVRTKS